MEGFLTISRDVSDRKHAQEALKSALDELEMRVKERTASLQKENDLLKKQIEERIRAERKLKESEEKYRGLFESSGDAVFITDIETGKIFDAKKIAEVFRVTSPRSHHLQFSPVLCSSVFVKNNRRISNGKKSNL